jgi:DNA-binding LacI/PurR family transcriptional regulator
MDNRAGGRLATEHLLDQGYRKVGIITGPANWWEAQERLEGWREVIGERNLAGCENLICEGDWEAQSGEQGFRALYATAPDLDAVFVCNDQMSLGALHAANSLGLKVPADVGIVGFDDIPEAGYFSPPLTTVRQDIRELGSQAVSWLMESIKAVPDEEHFRTQEHFIVPELIVRRSSVRGKS